MVLRDELPARWKGKAQARHCMPCKLPRAPKPVCFNIIHYNQSSGDGDRHHALVVLQCQELAEDVLR